MISKIGNSRARFLWAFAFFLLVGIAIRVWLAEAAQGKTWSDSAIIALMAMHELHGRFYTFYWGQAYMGSIESLVVAPFFAWLGANDFALCLGLLPWYLPFALAIYFVTRRCGGSRAAVIATALAALLPPYVQYNTTLPRGDYPETLAFGTILLALALRITYENLTIRAERLHLLAVGFVAGLAFWTNWLVFPYFIVVALYLLLHDWRLPFCARGWAALAAFFLGSLPFWAYNLRHGFESFSFLQGWQRPEGRLVTLRDALTHAVPLLTGTRDLLHEDAFTWGLTGKALSLLGALAAVILVVSLRRSWQALLRGRVREASPTAALVILAVAAIWIYAVSLPGRLHVARYLLPLVSATVPLLALGIDGLARRARFLGVAVFFGLCAFYTVQLFAFHDDLAHHAVRPGVDAPIEGLRDYLLRSPIRFGYAVYGDAILATYLTGERVVLTDLQMSRYPLDEVTIHDPAIILRENAGEIETTFASLNAESSLTKIPGYRIYWPIRYDGVPRRPLPRAGWKITANAHDEEARYAIDSDPASRWSAQQIEGGLTLTVDLGREETVTGIFVDRGFHGYDWFHRLAVDASTDGERWERVKEAQWDRFATFDRDGNIMTAPKSPQDAYQLVLFSPRSARRLRLTLLEAFRHYNWTVHELLIFGLGPPGSGFELPDIHSKPRGG